MKVFTSFFLALVFTTGLLAQIELDPVYRLYIPLGDDITDAVACMEDLRTLLK